MTKVNGKMLLGMAIHILCVWSVSAGDYPAVLGIIMGVFLMMNFIGLFLIAVDSVRVGCIVFIVGCVAFVPIGLIGLIGARNVMDEMKRQQFVAQSQ